MTSSLTVSGAVVGMLSGEKFVGPISSTNANTVSSIVNVTLASGDNTIAIPTNAVVVLIVLSSSISQTIKVRTNLDSGGCTLGNPNYAPFTVIPVPSNATSLIINSSATTSAPTEVTFL